MMLAALTALFMGLGYLIGGTGGALIALVIAAGMNLFTYWNADKIVLRMHNAQEVDARSCPQLFGIVEELARRGGLPTPRVYLIDEPSQCLRHRPQPAERRGRRHDRPARHPRPGRGRRGDGA